ncbi:isopenicillin N synthase family dioxygenase [Falsiruegeria mediterranea]|uniref:2-oxoglutarate-dependent ethylene/succinate-forming enzyme n=1 Tax=Falsiruegeria mediterranea M17 TaxID=1200281 RepID=A0A2R8C457_9RHOB|nr:2-oxoglutarate and iron-dependent oxygenase domain-containing protein [Falsiruegeria mediterranea]SPJ27192.1 2-oxoglutarate-dependent ethylene/succinate-forming enzyme [Falsiruegeria mediterranea M17]
MLENLDLQLLKARDEAELDRLSQAVRGVGFLKITNTGISAARVMQVIEMYRAFFVLPEAAKSAVDMAHTGSNRGWGGGQSEQVDPKANPDYKQVFDCGYELVPDHPVHARNLSVYAPNQWPDAPKGFREDIQLYFQEASGVAMEVLRAIAHVVGQNAAAFDAAFDPPMALLRGNYYPERPAWAGARDFGIAAHTDYGCLTLLATDGVPGLEVKRADGTWDAVTTQPGEYVINFGEMLEFWTAGQVKATEHRVVGSADERLSVPLFFNPSFDTNVAPPGSGEVITAGAHLTRRYDETYVHLQNQNA